MGIFFWECNGNGKTYIKLIFTDSCEFTLGCGIVVRLLGHYYREASVSDYHIIIPFLGHWPQLEAVYWIGCLFGWPIMEPFVFFLLFITNWHCEHKKSTVEAMSLQQNCSNIKITGLTQSEKLPGVCFRCFLFCSRFPVEKRRWESLLHGKLSANSFLFKKVIFLLCSLELCIAQL